MSAKPQNIDEYKEWLKNTHSIEVTQRLRIYYESVTSKMKADFENSDFWKQFLLASREYDSEYNMKTGYPLFIAEHKPSILVKDFDSFLHKTFRKNILHNSNWPNAPKGGWILPSNWYSRINDVLRTLLIVKYLDGVEYLIENCNSYCRACSMPFSSTLEAREEGYYAAHMYVRYEFEIPKIEWDTEKINASIEIQITTQLQEVIRKLLHKYYESHRERSAPDDTKWQWQYESDEFLANYLGHILHYIEGMIIEVRERQKETVV